MTERERAVLTASATGLGVAEVADLLDESPESVRRALFSVLTKLGARSKLEAVLIALRHGLIELSSH